MTDAERKLWRHLKGNSFPDTHFRHQAPIGPYFADFACHNSRLVIEVDGGGHALPETSAADAARTAYLAESGYRVLRLWNNDVLSNIDGVLTAIGQALSETKKIPHP